MHTHTHTRTRPEFYEARGLDAAVLVEIGFNRMGGNDAGESSAARRADWLDGTNASRGGWVCVWKRGPHTNSIQQHTAAHITQHTCTCFNSHPHPHHHRSRPPPTPTDNVPAAGLNITGLQSTLKTLVEQHMYSVVSLFAGTYTSGRKKLICRFVCWERLQHRIGREVHICMGWQRVGMLHRLAASRWAGLGTHRSSPIPHCRR